MTNPRDDLMAPEIDLHTYCGADARRWAEAFSQIKARQGWSVDDIDTDLMIGWFANAIEVACALRLAASRPAPVDREAVAQAFVDGALAVHNEWKQDHEGKNKGPPRGDPDFSEAAHDYVSLLRPAEPVDAIRPDTVAQRTWFDGENIRTENLTADDIYQKPPTTDDVGEPVAWRARRLEWVERIGVDGTFDASTSIGHYIATITDDGRGMWFIVGLTTSNYIDGDISAVQFAAQSDYENRIRSAIEVAPHPHAQPDISAAVLAERERCAAIADE